MPSKSNRLFKNKYRIESIRLPGWNYADPGEYFVTICTKNHIQYFGKVINGKMKLSKIGHVAQKCWQEIPNHYPQTELDEFVVMPNHVQGIVIIKNTVERKTLRLCHHIIITKINSVPNPKTCRQ